MTYFIISYFIWLLQRVRACVLGGRAWGCNKWIFLQKLLVVNGMKENEKVQSNANEARASAKELECGEVCLFYLQMDQITSPNHSYFAGITKIFWQRLQHAWVISHRDESVTAHLWLRRSKSGLILLDYRSVSLDRTAANGGRLLTGSDIRCNQHSKWSTDLVWVCQMT